MRVTITIILMALLCICGTVVYSQKKVQSISSKRAENAIEVAFTEMQNSLKRGDYEKANEISKRLEYSLNSYEKKQRTSECIVKSKKLLDLRFEAYAALRDKKYKLAQEKYDNILRENPTDNITKNDKNNLISIINQPKDNVLEKALLDADKIFDDAINTRDKNGIIETERKLSEARKIWTVIKQTSPNYQSDIISKNILATNEILKGSNNIKVAIATGNLNKAIQLAKGLEGKYPEIGRLSAEMIKEAKENKQKYFVWKKESEDAFCNLNYQLVLKKIKAIRQLSGYEKDPYVKFNGRKFDVEYILKAKSDIEEIKNDGGRTDIILAYYENIYKKNGCDKSEYFSFVKERLISTSSFINSNSCDRVLKYGMLLLSINEQKAVLDGVKTKIDNCNKQITCIDKCRNFYQIAYTVANQQKKEGRLIEAEKRLNDDVISKESEIIDCKCDTILVKSRALLSDISNEKKWNLCIDKAKEIIKIAFDNREKKLFEEALININAIDTVCLKGTPNLLTQIRDQRKEIEFERKEFLYIALRDSALTQESQGFYKDLFVLFGKAKAAFPDSARLDEINKIITTKCCIYKGLESKSKDDVCSFCGENCCPSIVQAQLPLLPKDSSQIKKIEIVIGGNFTNGFLQIGDVSQQGRYPFNSFIGANLGVRYTKNNFTKIIENRIGINSTYSTIAINSVLQTNLGGGSIQGNIGILSLEVPLDLKWHRRKTYHDEPRYFVVTGVHFGKNTLIKTNLKSNFQETIIQRLNSFYAGYKIGVGAELSTKKTGFSLELDYRMKGNFYENKLLTSPINSTANFNTINLTIGFRVW